MYNKLIGNAMGYWMNSEIYEKEKDIESDISNCVPTDNCVMVDGSELMNWECDKMNKKEDSIINFGLGTVLEKLEEGKRWVDGEMVEYGDVVNKERRIVMSKPLYMSFNKLVRDLMDAISERRDENEKD